MNAIAETSEAVLASPSPKLASQVATPAAQEPMPAEYLSFRLRSEEYGIDILRVQETRSYEVPNRLANAPHFIKGVVNLRGVIVPIVDLRLKLGCASAGTPTSRW